MSVAEIKEELARLTNAERIELSMWLWDLVESKDGEIQSPDWHAEELKRREEEIASGKAKFIPWEEAKDRILRAPRLTPFNLHSEI